MKKKLYWFFATIIALILLTKIIGINIPVLVVDGIILLCLLPMDKNTVLYSMVFILPLSACFESSSHIWILFSIILLTKKAKVGLAFVVCSLVLVTLELFAHFYYDISDINRVVGYLSGVILFAYIILEMTRNKIIMNNALKIYCISSFALIMFYFFSAIAGGQTDIFKILFEDGLRFGGTAGEEFSNLSINLNANTIAYYCVSEIAIALVLFKNRSLSHNQKILYAITTIAMVIFGILTGSRTFIITLTLCIILFWFCNLKTPKQIIVSAIALLLMTAITVIVVNLNIPAVDSLIERFGRNDITSMNGRTDILAQYIEKFTSSDLFLFLGSGVADYRYVYNLDLSIHNGIAQALICYGVIGFMFFLYITLKPIALSIRNKQKFYKYIPLIVCFVFVQTIQLLNPFILMFPFALSYLAIFSENSNRTAGKISNSHDEVTAKV